MATPVLAVEPQPLAPEGTRILVVDDNPRVRRSTATALTRAGYHVLTADNGAPAIELAETTAPDLALVDFDLPTPGLTVVRRLKELFGPAIWVAVLSGDDHAEMRRACFEAGADDVLAKPTPIPELQRRVVAAARLQRAYVEARLARESTDRLLAYGAEASAMLAHDLNNGLAVALCNMEFLELTADSLDADQLQAVALTRTALKRMSNLVANFVDVARFEDAALRPRCAHAQVRQLLEDVITLHTASSKSAFAIDCAPELAGHFDNALIERVLHTLVGNATRCCAPKGLIHVSAVQADAGDPTSIEISVTYAGPPIASDLTDTLFAKFGRGPDGKRGFGLHFCRLACEAHNGRIAYHHTLAGPTFSVRLPGR